MNNNEKIKLLKKQLHEVGQQILLMKLKRKSLNSVNDYISPKEISLKMREFSELARQYRKLRKIELI